MKRIIIILFILPVWANAQQKTVTVHFDFDQSVLTPAATATLDSTIAILKKTNATVTLFGHCDGKGSDAYNDVLSERRVQAVQQYFTQHQINTITEAKGFGKRQPLNDNTTDDDRAMNRRVEIHFEVVPPVQTPAPVAAPEPPVEPVKETPIITNKKLTEVITDTAVKAGSQIVLNNINFVGGMHQFLPESYPVLKELLQLMQTNPKLVIQIQGHICCLPGNVDGYDFQTQTTDLSTTRAKAVMDYLVENGIDKKRLSFVGLGHSQPLYSYPEKNEQERKLNRRVEIKIISK